MYLATVLSETIGYTQAADIAKQSMQTGKTIREIAEGKGFLKGEPSVVSIKP